MLYDPEYERLHKNKENWLEMISDPYYFESAAILNNMPEKITIDDKIVARFFEESSMTINIENIIRYIVGADLQDKAYEEEILRSVSLMYIFKSERSSAIDIATKKVIGSMSLYKIQNQYIDLNNQLNISINNSNSIYNMHVADLLHTRPYEYVANEIIKDIYELFNIKTKIDFRKKYNNHYILKLAFSKLKDNVVSSTWKIRNHELLIRISNYICKYVLTGHIKYIRDLYRVKCILRRNGVIYSLVDIDE